MLTEVLIKDSYKSSDTEMDPRQIQDFLERFLITVQKPGRYTGGEYHQIGRDWDDADIHVALAFPDIYEIGFSNLGLSILYHEINSRKNSLAERVFAPWIDFEELLRRKNIPLYALESKTPINKFDLLGFSLPYETLYTNALNMLDLSGIPIFSKERTEKDPVVIAGGHACFNPEPMYAFVDAFVIGDGEMIIHKILDCLIDKKKDKASRKQRVDALGSIPGIYVPSHFKISYQTDKTIRNIDNIYDPEKKEVAKNVAVSLPSPPINPLVPNISVVHDRLAVEIMRGCTRGCRFCQAGMITRPLRERPVEEILGTISRLLLNTGYEEISLLSLSTSDYSKISELIPRLSQFSKTFNFNFSLPSLRIESFTVEITDELSDSRKASFTLAPESASEKIRSVINKPISDGELLETAGNIFEKGWRNIKLYFMIGFPGETIDDAERIADLCMHVKQVGKEKLNRLVNIHVSINTLIPKPHTPFQWISIDSEESIQEKIGKIRSKLRKSGIKMDWPDYQTSVFESWLSRGDRRISEVIHKAWQDGAKFDAWGDHFKIEIWRNAFESIDINPEFYSHRNRPEDEVFPWDHIHTGVSKRFLLQEYKKSKRGEFTSDCRYQCHACGIQTCYGIRCDELRVPEA